MRREIRDPRPDYVRKVEQLGLTFHTVDGEPYWTESVAYVFEPEEISVLETATNELHAMCLEAVERLVVGGELGRLGVPPEAQPIIAEAWEADPPAIYGRFDLSYDGQHPPKMLEYNADTPTSLLEAAVVQWHWLQEVHPEADQFNSIWEGLVQKWRDLKAEGLLESGRVHFACMEPTEDLMTTAVLMDAAQEAGLEVNLLPMSAIGWDAGAGRFVDRDLRPIQTLFKLYPWEWMLTDEFGPYALGTYRHVQWIEPIWKMVLSNKAILAILWEMFPGHSNLLPAYLDSPRDMTEYVRKPFLGREGANVTIVKDGQRIEVGGPYGGRHVCQAYSPLPVFDGNHAVIGSWVIDGEARGIGVRESNGPITEDLARFVPHYFWPIPEEPASGPTIID
jgi:glutathionylspermidine synthase